MYMYVQGRQKRFHDRILFQVEAAPAEVSNAHSEGGPDDDVIRNVDDIDMSTQAIQSIENAGTYHPYAFRWVKSRLQP